MTFVDDPNYWLKNISEERKMKMKRIILKKILLFSLVLVMVTSMLPGIEKVHAKTLGTPKIKVKVLKDNSGFKITINKTKNAQSYFVDISYISDESLYTLDGYKFGSDFTNTYNKSVYKDGTEKRTIKIKANKITGGLKTLLPGTYKVRVSAFYQEDWYLDYYSETVSKTKTIKISADDDKTARINPSLEDLATVEQGGIITFGNYEQDGNFENGAESIEWIVLSKNDSQVLLFSRYALDRLPYNINDDDCTWESSSLRRWLNEKFYDVAFSDAEKALIATTTNENPYYMEEDDDLEPGNDTEDKVFLLSEADVSNEEYGFNSELFSKDKLRSCVNTKYCQSRGAESVYWLRDLGSEDEDESMASYVNDKGFVFTIRQFGMYVSCDYEYDDGEDYGVPDISNGYAVRPAIVLNLE